MRKIGLWLAIAALLVNGPRFVIIFLRIDNIAIPLQAEAIMLGATGVATGLVLTGGGAYIAHCLAESRARGVTQFVMVLCWFLLLVFSVILLAPLMVSAIRISSLESILKSSFSQWAWSVTAVAAVEIISAGAMAAYAIEERAGDGTIDKPDNTAFSLLTNALVRRLEKGIVDQTPPVTSSSVTPVQRTAINSQLRESVDKPQVSQLTEQKQIENAQQQLETTYGGRLASETDEKYSKAERQALMLEMLQQIKEEEDIQIEGLAQKLQVSRQTIYRDLADLKSRGLLQPDR